jgi:hypothetical protein
VRLNGKRSGRRIALRAEQRYDFILNFDDLRWSSPTTVIRIDYLHLCPEILPQPFRISLSLGWCSLCVVSNSAKRLVRSGTFSICIIPIPVCLFPVFVGLFMKLRDLILSLDILPL